MHILLVAATTFEIQPVTDYIQQHSNSIHPHAVSILVAGIGSMATTYHLTRQIAGNKPDFIIQAGIGGSFSPHFQPGRVVLVDAEMIGDLGVEEGGHFKDLFDMGLQQDEPGTTNARWLKNPHVSNWEGLGLALVRGITVNEITTDPLRIKHFQQNTPATVESMEGAALHYVCLRENIPFMQIRAVSNMVGVRDKQQWKMKEAIVALNEQLINIIKTL
ncbi:futalosine hydrolase [Paraflavitalea sp. CAU 1676]|uniref:futalosine hydrolase n=1 Tax=Paraflavitalea sp. CAU 1676 TaxID=3032598 RepID=UPI0023DA2871|nr:futalosine hydrolase [Paraflavitalea sp. CAU 1676]MDF2192220.1 futalosine hydrolase [Paraflavitalea sp. CAU 1676]